MLIQTVMFRSVTDLFSESERVPRLTTLAKCMQVECLCCRKEKYYKRKYQQVAYGWRLLPLRGRRPSSAGTCALGSPRIMMRRTSGSTLWSPPI